MGHELEKTTQIPPAAELEPVAAARHGPAGGAHATLSKTVRLRLSSVDELAVLISGCSSQLAYLWRAHLKERSWAAQQHIVAAGFGAAVGTGHSYLVMLLPLAFTMLGVYAYALNNEVMALGGYRSAMEEFLSRQLGSPSLTWESRVARGGHNRLPITLAWTFQGLVFVSGSVLAMVQATRAFHRGGWGYPHGTLLVVLTGLTILSGLGVIAIAVREQGRTQKWTRDAVAAALRGDRWPDRHKF